ncbi:dCTP deaminase domain-containing protein [Bacteroides graminisolvens]
MLCDTEIVEYILSGEIVNEGLPLPYSEIRDINDPRWYEKESPVQASSLDLHVGEIHIPNGICIFSNDSKNRIYLKPGQTIVVVTKETLKLPSNLCGFGFPPDSLSQQGVLMVNLGHIDPGWHGKIKFVLINVGKIETLIKIDDVVATMLFCKLNNSAKKDYCKRRSGDKVPFSPRITDISKHLSRDFLNIDKRAKEISTGIIGKASLITFALVMLFSSFLTIGAFFLNNNMQQKVDELDKKILEVRKDIEYSDAMEKASLSKSRSDALELKIDSLNNIIRKK